MGHACPQRHTKYLESAGRGKSRLALATLPSILLSSLTYYPIFIVSFEPCLICVFRFNSLFLPLSPVVVGLQHLAPVFVFFFSCDVLYSQRDPLNIIIDVAQASRCLVPSASILRSVFTREHHMPITIEKRNSTGATVQYRAQSSWEWCSSRGRHLVLSVQPPSKDQPAAAETTAPPTPAVAAVAPPSPQDPPLPPTEASQPPDSTPLEPPRPLPEPPAAPPVVDAQADDFIFGRLFLRPYHVAQLLTVLQGWCPKTEIRREHGAVQLEAVPVDGAQRFELNCSFTVKIADTCTTPAPPVLSVPRSALCYNEGDVRRVRVPLEDIGDVSLLQSHLESVLREMFGVEHRYHAKAMEQRLRQQRVRLLRRPLVTAMPYATAPTAPAAAVEDGILLGDLLDLEGSETRMPPPPASDAALPTPPSQAGPASSDEQKKREMAERRRQRRLEKKREEEERQERLRRERSERRRAKKLEKEKTKAEEKAEEKEKAKAKEKTEEKAENGTSVPAEAAATVTPPPAPAAAAAPSAPPPPAPTPAPTAAPAPTPAPAPTAPAPAPTPAPAPAPAPAAAVPPSPAPDASAPTVQPQAAAPESTKPKEAPRRRRSTKAAAKEESNEQQEAKPATAAEGTADPPKRRRRSKAVEAEGSEKTAPQGPKKAASKGKTPPEIEIGTFRDFSARVHRAPALRLPQNTPDCCFVPMNHRRTKTLLVDLVCGVRSTSCFALTRSLTIGKAECLCLAAAFPAETISVVVPRTTHSRVADHRRSYYYLFILSFTDIFHFSVISFRLLCYFFIMLFYRTSCCQVSIVFAIDLLLSLPFFDPQWPNFVRLPTTFKQRSDEHNTSTTNKMNRTLPLAFGADTHYRLYRKMICFETG
eukprot:gene4188-3026_t